MKDLLTGALSSTRLINVIIICVWAGLSVNARVLLPIPESIIILMLAGSTKKAFDSALQYFNNKQSNKDK